MKKNIMKRWVAALRSGKYNKTVGCLHETSCDGKKEYHCVLGVLIDLYIRDKKRKKEPIGLRLNPPDKRPFFPSASRQPSYINSSSSELPKKVAKWAGFGNTYPITGNVDLWYGNQRTTLVSLNDGMVWEGKKGKTFGQMAKIIEKHWESL